jgi:DNA-binding HxlR family transcriptional regulator
MNIEDKIKVGCEIEVTLKVIGGKCKPLILYLLMVEGTKRFKELMSSITQISQKTLTNQLRELEADGMISRKAFSEIPPRVEYSITEKGKSIFQILEAMCTWGHLNMGEKFILTVPQCKDKKL